ncbi:helix-turn-helix domain-containing protein [Haliangium sp.]|uniref:helix-turn-helix domain-containing protein n=1 Tax=Haliangium sp. TaxID=2663208 RepID=UPI003D09D3A4
MPANAARRSTEEQLRRMDPVGAPPDQLSEFIEVTRLLTALGQRRPSECMLVGPSGAKIAIPESMFFVLKRVAEVMARGDAIAIVPVDQEMSTQQAANLLNVSRQYLVRLLDEGRIPFVKTGRHRRLRVEHVLAFKEQRDRERGAGLDELSRMSEDLGGYDELE